MKELKRIIQEAHKEWIKGTPNKEELNDAYVNHLAKATGQYFIKAKLEELENCGSQIHKRIAELKKEEK